MGRESIQNITIDYNLERDGVAEVLHYQNVGKCHLVIYGVFKKFLSVKSLQFPRSMLFEKLFLQSYLEKQTWKKQTP